MKRINVVSQFVYKIGTYRNSGFVTYIEPIGCFRKNDDGVVEFDSEYTYKEDIMNLTDFKLEFEYDV